MFRPALIALSLTAAAPALAQTFVLPGQAAPNRNQMVCPDLVPTPVTFSVQGSQLHAQFRVRNIGTGAMVAPAWTVTIRIRTGTTQGWGQFEEATVTNLPAGGQSQTFTVIRPVVPSETVVEILGVPGECNRTNNTMYSVFHGA